MSLLRIPSWSLFCACSWTWCIGMYLPIVMLQRYGWPGFLAFAVPNIVGCALFGYLVRTPDRSRRLVAEHGSAMRWFSAVTIGYHLYFAAWLGMDLLPTPASGGAMPVAVPLALCAVGLVLSTIGDRWWPLLAVIAYGTSLGTLLTLLPGGLADIPWTGDREPRTLLAVAPVLCFGFLLCPYLDATFHRALQRSGSPHTFGLFAIAFAIMILLTCAYWGRPGLRLETLVLAHLAVQSAFTVGAHMRELARSAGTRRPAWLLGPLLAVALIYLTRAARDPQAAAADTYLRFLVFYGALFPAYVLLLVGAPPRRRRIVVALLAVTLVLAPFYELGMLGERPWLLVPPVLLYLAWAVLGRRSRRQGSTRD